MSFPLSITPLPLEKPIGSTTSVEPSYVLGSTEVSGVTHTTTAAYQSEDISSAGLTRKETPARSSYLLFFFFLLFSNGSEP